MLKESDDRIPDWDAFESSQEQVFTVNDQKHSGPDSKDESEIGPKEPDGSELAKRYQYADEAIGRLRDKLLDLSRRNPLVSFTHSGRSASQLRVVDERLDHLFKALQKGEMGFEPLPGRTGHRKTRKRRDSRLHSNAHD